MCTADVFLGDMEGPCGHNVLEGVGMGEEREGNKGVRSKGGWKGKRRGGKEGGMEGQNIVEHQLANSNIP